MLNKQEILRGLTDTLILGRLYSKDSYGYEINKQIALKNTGDELADYATKQAAAIKSIDAVVATLEEDDEEIKEIKNHFKKKPENFMEYMDKKYLNASLLDEFRRKLKNITKSPAEFVKSLVDLAMVSDTELEKYRKAIRDLLKKNPKEMTWKDSEVIVNVLQDMDFMAPSTVGLRPIPQEDHL